MSHKECYKSFKGEIISLRVRRFPKGKHLSQTSYNGIVFGHGGLGWETREEILKQENGLSQGRERRKFQGQVMTEHFTLSRVIDK
jgi:hypothetical protein